MTQLYDSFLKLVDEIYKVMCLLQVIVDFTVASNKLIILLVVVWHNIHQTIKFSNNVPKYGNKGLPQHFSMFILFIHLSDLFCGFVT